MPKPLPPPTPGSSSDLRGKEGAQTAPTFNLPPNALQETDRASSTATTPSANGSDSSYRPVSPSSPADLSRKRTISQSGPQTTKEDFALPPPPTRSRKIIQMKPKDSDQEQYSPQTMAMAASPPSAAKSQNGAQTGGRKGRNTSNTTAAGRKIARKTAHSLIERRRRSKMNEEFGVLKDMIPACKGQEMHKLAILQASIDYLRYLERCVADLQANNSSPTLQQSSAPRRREETQNEDKDDEMVDDDDDNDEDDDEDGGDGDTAASTPATLPQDRSGSMISLPSLSQITTTTTNSPSTFSTRGGARHYSVSSASQASYSPYFHSNQTSPAFGPQLSNISSASSNYLSSRDTLRLGSPAIRPLDSSYVSRHAGEEEAEVSEKRRRTNKSGRSEQELDQEATAALLMLNNDRRNWRANRDGDGNRSGMSVRDLLSG